jgi:hypothetical protein
MNRLTEFSVVSEIYPGPGHDGGYNWGSETLSLASSKDGGKTWKKSEKNPFLPGPPQDLEVSLLSMTVSLSLMGAALAGDRMERSLRLTLASS